MDKPEAERADTKAQGPGMGMTVIFASTHNFAYINILYIHTKIKNYTKHLQTKNKTSRNREQQEQANNNKIVYTHINTE